MVAGGGGGRMTYLAPSNKNICFDHHFMPSFAVDNLPTTSNQDNPKPLENLKPVTSDAPESVDPPTTTSPEVSPSPLSPTESLASSQDSQTLNKSKTGSSGSEKHQRTRTISGSGSEVIKRSLKDLQRSSVSISRYQAMLDEVCAYRIKIVLVTIKQYIRLYNKT